MEQEEASTICLAVEHTGLLFMFSFFQQKKVKVVGCLLSFRGCPRRVCETLRGRHWTDAQGKGTGGAVTALWNGQLGGCTHILYSIKLSLMYDRENSACCNERESRKEKQSFPVKARPCARSSSRWPRLFAFRANATAIKPYR